MKKTKTNKQHKYISQKLCRKVFINFLLGLLSGKIMLKAYLTNIVAKMAVGYQWILRKITLVLMVIFINIISKLNQYIVVHLKQSVEFQWSQNEIFKCKCSPFSLFEGIQTLKYWNLWLIYKQKRSIWVQESLQFSQNKVHKVENHQEFSVWRFFPGWHIYRLMFLVLNTRLSHCFDMLQSFSLSVTFHFSYVWRLRVFCHPLCHVVLKEVLVNWFTEVIEDLEISFCFWCWGIFAPSWSFTCHQYSQE